MASDRPTPGSQSSLREANRARLVEAVRRRGPLTQVELAGVTGLSPASVSTIVRELAGAGVLTVTPTSRSGRRALRVDLAVGPGLVGAVRVAERFVRVALADGADTLVAEELHPLAPGHTAQATLEDVAAVLAQLLADAGTAHPELVAVGVALPGPVDVATGRLSVPGILAGWDGVAVGDVLADRLGTAVVVDNDANLGALAEARVGAARGLQHVAYLRASHGVGLGLVLGGAVFRGRSGGAGEIGHLVVDDDGLPCRCGHVGCLETVVASERLVARLRPTHGQMTLRELVTAALEGDADCRAVVAEAGRALGRAVAAVCAVVEPEAVVVGGELAHAGEVLLGPLRETAVRRAATSGAGPVRVELSQLGDMSEVRGALVAARDLAVAQDPAVVPGR